MDRVQLIRVGPKPRKVRGGILLDRRLALRHLAKRETLRESIGHRPLVFNAFSDRLEIFPGKLVTISRNERSIIRERAVFAWQFAEKGMVYRRLRLEKSPQLRRGISVAHMSRYIALA